MSLSKNMYARSLRDSIKRRIGSGKAIILIGPRQVGKTTLLQTILANKDYLFFDCDDPKTRTLLAEPNTQELRTILKNYKVVFIDEAQRVKGIGLTLKIITDQFKWSERKRTKLPKTFVESYSAESKVITRSNFREFVIMT